MMLLLTTRRRHRQDALAKATSVGAACAVTALAPQHCWPDFEVGCKRLARLVIERNGISLAAFMQNPDTPGVVRVTGDAFGQLEIMDGQPRKFCASAASVVTGYLK